MLNVISKYIGLIGAILNIIIVLILIIVAKTSFIITFITGLAIGIQIVCYLYTYLISKKTIKLKYQNKNKLELLRKYNETQYPCC